MITSMNQKTDDDVDSTQVRAREIRREKEIERGRERERRPCYNAYDSTMYRQRNTTDEDRIHSIMNTQLSCTLSKEVLHKLLSIRRSQAQRTLSKA